MRCILVFYSNTACTTLATCCTGGVYATAVSGGSSAASGMEGGVLVYSTEALLHASAYTATGAGLILRVFVKCALSLFRLH